MLSYRRELVSKILHLLEQEKFMESVHKLEQESGFFFNVEYFEEKVLAGEWEEVEKYLFGFTTVVDNRYSMETFFVIRLHKYLEALDRQDKAKAIEILVGDLKVFSNLNGETYKILTQLLALDNFRKNEQFSRYGDTKASRNVILLKLKMLIEANPLFHGKLVFPTPRSSRLRTLVNQSPNSDIQTLFTDHRCTPPTGALAPTPVSLPAAAVAKPAVYAPPGVRGVTYPTVTTASWSLDELPRTVAFTLHQGSVVTALDFHPFRHKLLLVGCADGEIALWDVGNRVKLCLKPFKVQFCTRRFEDSAAPISVNRVKWSPYGTLCGAAFSKHLIHLYTYVDPNDLCHNLEIDAHDGGVNDIAFANPNRLLCLVTCGDDKLIKVWDITGSELFRFEGHEARVCSICPNQKENIQFILSTALDGKIRAWLYRGLKFVCDAPPGHWCSNLLYNADGNRLFSCGTGIYGDPFLVEWNDGEGSITRTYTGFTNKSAGVMQFDTTRNRFLAVGEDSQIKFWYMDNTNIIATADAGGGLPSLPRLRFNKEGNLLAVTADTGIKILANAAGMMSLCEVEAPRFINRIEQISVSSVANAAPVSRPMLLSQNLRLVDQPTPGNLSRTN